MKGRLGLSLVALAVLTSSCSPSAVDRLDALRSDPMASYDLPGALSVEVFESVGHIRPPGVGSPSSITRTFTVAAGTSADELEVIADAARREGWRVSVSEFSGFSGDKTIDGWYSQIRITGIESDDLVWFELSSGDS